MNFNREERYSQPTLLKPVAIYPLLFFVTLVHSIMTDLSFGIVCTWMLLFLVEGCEYVKMHRGHVTDDISKCIDKSRYVAALLLIVGTLFYEFMTIFFPYRRYSYDRKPGYHGDQNGDAYSDNYEYRTHIWWTLMLLDTVFYVLAFYKATDLIKRGALDEEPNVYHQGVPPVQRELMTFAPGQPTLSKPYAPLAPSAQPKTPFDSEIGVPKKYETSITLEKILGPAPENYPQPPKSTVPPPVSRRDPDCCSLCSVPLNDKSPSGTLPKSVPPRITFPLCGHVYHTACLERSSTPAGACPVCHTRENLARYMNAYGGVQTMQTSNQPLTNSVFINK